MVSFRKMFSKESFLSLFPQVYSIIIYVYIYNIISIKLCDKHALTKKHILIYVIEINFSCEYHVIRCICLAVIEKIVVPRERVNHGPCITYTCNHIMCFPTTSYIIIFPSRYFLLAHENESINRSRSGISTQIYPRFSSRSLVVFACMMKETLRGSNSMRSPLFCEKYASLLL